MAQSMQASECARRHLSKAEEEGYLIHTFDGFVKRLTLDADEEKKKERKSSLRARC